MDVNREDFSIGWCSNIKGSGIIAFKFPAMFFFAFKFILHPFVLNSSDTSNHCEQNV